MTSRQGGKGWKHSAQQASVTTNTTAAATALGVPALPFCKYAAQNCRCYPELASP